MSENNDQESVRLDKWLWAARFYKTRSTAATAITAGNVELNGIQPKRAKPVKVGDQVHVHKGPYTWELTVQALAERRGSATEAQKLYLESQDSMDERKRVAEALALERASAPAPVIKGRPTKKDRRALSRLKPDPFDI